jgi:3-isopropylmalate/(R)-2-methylmalate dehydratase large subunit
LRVKPVKLEALTVPQTLAEKIIAHAAGKDRVTPGEIVTCRVDLAMMHDSGGPRRVAPILQQLDAEVWDPDRVVVISDHYVPAVDAESAAILDLTRKWVRANGVEKFHDMEGICHVVIQENAYLKPGMFVVGGDSHSPTGGAAGCFMFGVGATDMAGVLITGETWIRVPGTILIDWTGELSPGVSAKDMMLATTAKMGMGGGDYQVVEYSGEAVANLSYAERMTMCNLAAELGAQTGIIAADATTIEYLTAQGGDLDAPETWRGDVGAGYLNEYHFDAAELAPQVAAPHSPANTTAVSQQPDVSVDQAYIGACTGAKLEDLRMAAQVLKDQKVSSSTRLMIAPASSATTAAAIADGSLATLMAAGAVLLPSGCGACAGYGAGVLAEGETCIASTARNFQGRMGPHSSNVYLASPYTVAASAVAGYICDPRDMLSGKLS